MTKTFLKMIFLQKVQASEKDSKEGVLKMINIHIGNQNEVSMIGIKKIMNEAEKAVEKSQNHKRIRSKEGAHQELWSGLSLFSQAQPFLRLFHWL